MDTGPIARIRRARRTAVIIKAIGRIALFGALIVAALMILALYVLATAHSVSR